MNECINSLYVYSRNTDYVKVYKICTDHINNNIKNLMNINVQFTVQC